MGDAQAEPCVGGIEERATIPTAEIDAVFGLQTARWHHKARIGDVWTVGGYFVLAGRTVVSSRSKFAETRD